MTLTCYGRLLELPGSPWQWHARSSAAVVMSAVASPHLRAMRLEPCQAPLCLSQRLALQLEEDTDRDRYMSPLEAKNYGLIDNIIGGDSAGFDIQGSTRDFPRINPAHLEWGKDEEGRGGRFKGVPLEPYAKPLADRE